MNYSGFICLYCSDTNVNSANGENKSTKKIAKSLSRLSQEMWKTSPTSGSNHGVTDPAGFRRDMGTFSPKFMGFEQHDSQEFLLYALDGIHTELNRVTRPKQVNTFSGLTMIFPLLSGWFSGPDPGFEVNMYSYNVSKL